MKQKILVIVNILMFLIFISTVVSALIYRFIPSPLQGSEIMSSIHGISGLSFSGLALIHIILNWTWIKVKILRQTKRS